MSAPASAPIPIGILGGSGYVAGEALRLLATHPGFAVRAVVSTSRAGEPVGAAFPHLATAYPELRFAPAEALAELFATAPRAALLSAAPHGASAGAVAAALAAAAAAGGELAVADLSADFRFADPAAWSAVYGRPHPAPELLPTFARGVPEHLPASAHSRFAHPGCFATAFLLALVPLVGAGRIAPEIAATAITGSTGSGRQPSAATHHPERRSTVVAYAPLAHRHEPEVVAFVREATGVEIDLALVPQSGPQARGIYATLHARLARPASAAAVAAELAAAYAASPFVTVATAPPRLVDVAGSNRAALGVAVRGDRLALFAAIDNLAKGAAGGGLQWLNRRFGFPENAGLAVPGPGWF
ncbi:MAG: N-acetyl-gamma-glutamyl-phosphate reductase [Acidobacteriota bacterium]|nr:N-acetyl-gamma-glutamyl-phosphate reductase [Acidobacteriota bacterium]